MPPRQRPCPPDDEAVVDAWLATHRSANTRSAYRLDLQTFARWCAAMDAVPLRADADVLAAFQAARADAGDSAATLRRRWSALSSFYRFAQDASLVSENPAEGATRPPLPSGNPSPTPTLTQAAVTDYLSAAGRADVRLEALIALLALDGLKLGEALALDTDDVVGRPPRMTLTVRRRGTQTRVPLQSRSASAVRRCVDDRSGEPLFTSTQPNADSSARRLTRFGADHLLRLLADDGDERTTFNALRRFHFSSQHRAGTDHESIRRRTGLVSVRGVRRYLDDEPR